MKPIAIDLARRGGFVGAALACALLLVPAGSALAARYGDAAVLQGEMTILRSGQATRYEQGQVGIEVEEGDLIRLRSASRVTLNTIDKASLNLGSNAVFQVKPFEKKEEKGYFRVLFGRFRAKISGLAGNERFNVKTATATIGVKGTEYSSFTTTTGATGTGVTESQVTFIDNNGVTHNINLGQFSLALNEGAIPPIPTPEELEGLMNGDDLDSPSPNSPDADIIPGGSGLVNQGLLNPGQLNQSSTFDAGSDFGLFGVDDGDAFDFDTSTDEAQVIQGTLNLEFEK
jgi:hypothetical protein